MCLTWSAQRRPKWGNYYELKWRREVGGALFSESKGIYVEGKLGFIKRCVTVSRLGCFAWILFPASIIVASIHRWEIWDAANVPILPPFHGHRRKSEANLLCLTPQLQLPLLGRVERSVWQQNEHVMTRQYLSGVTKTLREWQGRDTHAESTLRLFMAWGIWLQDLLSLQTSWGKVYHKKSFYNNIESKWAFEKCLKILMRMPHKLITSLLLMCKHNTVLIMIPFP